LASTSEAFRHFKTRSSFMVALDLAQEPEWGLYETLFL